MFGKKKSVIQLQDFHCGVCGLDCSDQYNFERHVSWAHPGTRASKVGEQEDQTGSEKKA